MMAEDGRNLSGVPDARGSEGRSSLPRTFIRLNDLSGVGTGGGERGEVVVEPASPAPDGISTAGEEASASGEENLPYPTLAPVVFFYLKQTTRPRSWCLKMVCNPWFERASMLVILLNCVTLGMFHPCEDIDCDSERCKILQDFDDFIFAFFAIEMVIKMVALGIFGKKCYLGDTWNRLDFFIVVAGMLEYSLNLQNVSFSAVRTVRVLRPLRAINRVPSMRILVTLLLDTLPMLGNVLLLCFFVFFIFGIVGVQLWAGLLRNRCFLEDNFSFPLSVELEKYYHTENDDENPFICSQPRENGRRDCSSVPKLYEEGGLQCNLDMYSYNSTDNTTCVNWNQYYTNCSAGPVNPFKDAINFDNICYAWIAIFQVITLEGWVDIMYFVMDAHSFYNFIYFILLIIIGSFFMINLCLVVIATQFSETKQRESQLMKEQRVRFMSNASTLASLSEPGSCYDELLKYLVHIIRKGAKQVAHICRLLARRAGLNIAASPPATEPQRSQSQRRRRKSSRQGSVSVHHMVHHHHHHHHYHHYHLGNGSLRGGGTIRCPEGRDVEAGSHNNNGGTLVATACTGHLALAPPLPSVTAATSDTNLATLTNPAAAAADSSSALSVFHSDTLRCTPSPTNLGPIPGPFSLAPAPKSRAMKRNSVPFAAPGPKNYPTLQARALAESRRGSVAASTLTNISFNLNIPPMPLERRQQSLVDTHTPTAQISCQLSARDLSTTSSAMDTAALTLDPESCPYCAKALANESEGGTDGNETPGDSDSEGVYEFTQDLHHRDRQDSRQPRKKHRRLGKTAAKVVHFWRLVCDTFRKIVDSKYFGRGIMIAILINTLSMGIEYHEQPDELTNALEISNIVFTSLFALEMLLKVLVYGPFGYIKNPYNIFDGIIVVISVWEIVGQQGGGLSVLRTFRLMRVLKLVRFMPALQRQLVVLMKTMDNVATFCMLLMLFIFIFSILGMHLFGCKFGSERDGDTLPDRKNFDSLLWAIVTVFQILTQEDWNKVLYNGMASTTPVAALYFIALMTFGNYVLFNLLVAILVEGFQTEEVSKREDLHAQLSLIQLPVDSGGDASKSGSEIDSFARSMEDVNGSKKDLSASAVVPVNGHVDLKTSLTPPLITHTAATPMPVPKLPVGGDPILGYESRRGSNVSIDPASYDKSPTSARSPSPYAPWSSGSGRTSRRSSWNSLGRAPSLKRQKRQSGERRSLLSGEGGSSSEDGEGGGEGLMEEDDASLARTDSMSQSQRGPRHRRMESVETRSSMDLPPDALLQVPYLYRSASMHSSRPPSLSHLRPPEHSDCNGKGSPSVLGPTHVSLEDNTEDENAEEEANLSRFARLFRWLEKKQPEWCRQRDTWSLYLFPPESRFRFMCKKIITHKMFDHVVLVIIFLNCITIAMERPRIDPSSAERIFLTLSNYIFTAIFVAEMTIKIVALGWCFGEKAYLRSSWNILDGMLVMISVIDILVSLISNSGTKILGMLRVLRLLRTLRPLRVISRAPGLKLVVETLMSSLKPIGNIVVICCAFFIIFGILGVQLFKGKFFVCHGEDVRNITNKSDCLQANYKWVRHKYNFDNLGQALMSLFVLASKDGWVDIMYDGLDAVGVDQQPIMNYNPWMLLYFISFLLIVAFFVLNMFVGVVVENFHKCRRHQEAEEAKRREEKRLKRLEKKRRKAQSKPYYSDYSPTRLLIHKMCTSHYLDLFITIVIGLNVITMSMEHYQQPKELDEALKICNYIFTLIFVLESVFKLVAFGFRRFFKDKWNQLDLAIVLLSIMGITLEEIEVNASLPINPTIIRIMRVLRIARVLKLLKMAVGMRALLDTVMQALPQVGNLGLLFMLLFFIFAALGVELFGDLICDERHPCEGLGRYATFKNFGMAFLLLFRVSTGDNWNGIMKDTLRDCAHDTSTCYNTVVSPIYFVSFVLTAQFVLVNVVIAVLMKHLEESNKEAKEEAELEAELELELQNDGGDMATRSPQLNPLALGMDRSSSGGSPWRSTGGGDREQERDGPMDSPTADITRDSVNIRADPPSCLDPPLEGSMEGELSLMDNLSGSICHYYALPPRPSKHSTDKKIPLAEMEALSLASEKSWSLALTEDSVPDDFNPLFLTSQECNPEQLNPGEPLEDNLLSVRKPTVGRTHSLPNDSYMFLPLQPLGQPATAPAQLLAQTQGPQHILGIHKAQSGSSSSVRSQPEEFSQQLTVPTDLFKPISPHSHSDSESIPRLPPPRRRHTLSRTLRRQVAVSTDSQEALCSDGGESSEGLVNVASLGLPPSPSSSSSSSTTSPSPRSHHHQQPALCLVPATPGASPKPSRPSSVHTQHCLASYSPSSPPPLLPVTPHQQEEASADQEVSLITRAGLPGSDDMTMTTGHDSCDGGNEGYSIYAGCQESRSPCLRQLKRFHSADTQGRSTLLPRPRPYSWLDDPRRHSVEVCSSVESSPQRSTTSTSSGFVSRADSLQIHSQTSTQTSLPSPRRKKKMSPPCISVDPPDGLEPQSGLYPGLGGLGGMGLGGLGKPPPLPSRDTCLRRRAPSSDSKDSFDLGVGEGSGQDGGSPNPNTNPKLLTLPSFSFEKTSSEH
ncbi:voltage-dependent T-type calcium channel subunit alpha-1G isoform X4 [Thunnus albacares]|uniref:voltage-dependent T-type calcium channel subunit alpha-1G isoform X4 n=1 Tax=Thunnus albacares TaxID=8236 RepID=UPI001CF6D54A|nr:voltage-dependent T-type calcium channel subunit alpha-1G isoform X4 [Thunnus albacares]